MREPFPCPSPAARIQVNASQLSNDPVIHPLHAQYPVILPPHLSTSLAYSKNRTIANISSSSLVARYHHLRDFHAVNFHASRIMKSIRNLIVEEATIMHSGEWPTIPSVDIVGGDRVLLTLVSFFSSTIYYYTQINSKGNVPVHICIVVASSHLQFDRPLLTGERSVIARNFCFYIFICLILFSSSLNDITFGNVMSPSDNGVETRNLALNFTFVVQGKYTGVVFTTGNRTIMGRIVGNLLACLATPNSRPQTCKGEFGSSRRLFPQSPGNSFLPLWAAWFRNAFPGLKMLAVLSSTRLDVSRRSHIMYTQSLYHHYSNDYQHFDCNDMYSKSEHSTSCLMAQGGLLSTNIAIEPLRDHIGPGPERTQSPGIVSHSSHTYHLAQAHVDTSALSTSYCNTSPTFSHSKTQTLSASHMNKTSF